MKESAPSGLKKILSVRNVAMVVGVGMALFHLYTGVMGSLQAMRQGSIHLLFSFVLVFLLYPARKGQKEKHSVPWYDILAIVAAIVSLGYILLKFEWVAFDRFRFVTPVLPSEKIFGVLLILLVLESARRTIGLFLTIVAAFFIGYAFLGPYLPGILYHPGVSLDNFLDLQYLSDGGIFGTPIIISATYIVLFIIFGAFMLQTGFGEFITDVATGLTGRTRGGPAKVAVVSSAGFGTISGAGSANVVVTGTFTIPLMKKVGFKPHFAGAVEAVASTGGEIMPPIMGAAAFLMAKYTGIPYIQIIKYAAIPAVLYFVAVFFQVDLEAAKMGIRGLRKEELPPWKQKALSYLHLLIPVIMLLGLMVIGRTPYFAVTVSILATIALSFVRKSTRLTFTKFIAALVDGAKGALVVAVACALSGLVVGCIYQSGIGVRFSALMVALSGGHILLALIAAMLAALILGMGMPVSPAYILMVALIIPSIVKLGVAPVAAHLFAIYFCRASLVTPPVAISAYVAAGIARAPMAKTGWTAFRLGLTSFIVPFAFVYSQTLLLMGPPLRIIIACITALFGVYALAIGLEGYWTRRLNILQRMLAIGAAIVTIVPGWKTDLIGIAAMVLVFFWHRLAGPAAAPGGKDAAARATGSGAKGA
jgi:TRAP transporter 4TM/12TM fusion protein